MNYKGMVMQYSGKYKIFDSSRIKTYPLASRTNKVKWQNLFKPEDIGHFQPTLAGATIQQIEKLADTIFSSRKNDRPVVLFTGAHLIKNGLGPLIVELVKRKMLTLVAGNAATAIHDFELALVGETSENVPDALGKGQFGMAYEFAYINTALSLGNKHLLGFGETLGKMICEQSFRTEVMRIAAKNDSPGHFSHPEISVLASCYQNNLPFTVHAGIGVDVIDQHPSFDGEAKGGCSGRDFLIFAHEIAKLSLGGVFLNIGSAVTGPEVFLKAISMATNIRKKPAHIICANFDIKDYDASEMTDESAPGYYFRDQKSVVSRIPGAFHGQSVHIQGNQKLTIPLLFKAILNCTPELFL